MEIDLKITAEDWFAFQKYIQRKKQKELKGIIGGGFWSNLILWCVLTFVFVLVFRFFGRLHYQTAILLFIIFAMVAGLYFYYIMRLQRSFGPSEQGILVGRHQYKFDETGIHSNGEKYKCYYDWSSVQSIERENGMVMCFLDTAFALIFPENQLENPTDFMNKLRDYKV